MGALGGVSWVQGAGDAVQNGVLQTPESIGHLAPEAVIKIKICHNVLIKARGKENKLLAEEGCSLDVNYSFCTPSARLGWVYEKALPKRRYYLSNILTFPIPWYQHQICSHSQAAQLL